MCSMCKNGRVVSSSSLISLCVLKCQRSWPEPCEESLVAEMGEGGEDVPAQRKMRGASRADSLIYGLV